MLQYDIISSNMLMRPGFGIFGLVRRTPPEIKMLKKPKFAE
jgi:hypothetical protein